MTYHVLRNSRTEGSESFSCPDLDQAVTLMAQLATQAEQCRQQDGIQRYFCLSEEAATPPFGNVSAPLPDTLVIYVEGGAVQWVGSDNAHLRILILDADMDAADPPVACWEESPRPLSELEESVRERVFGVSPQPPSSTVALPPPEPPSTAQDSPDDLEETNVHSAAKVPAAEEAIPTTAPDRDAFGWNLALKDRQRLLQAQAALPTTPTGAVPRRSRNILAR